MTNNLSSTQISMLKFLKSHLSLIESACKQLTENIDDIATFYLLAAASANIITAIELPDIYYNTEELY